MVRLYHIGNILSNSLLFKVNYTSYLGNMGFYEESSRLNRKIVRELLRLRNMSHVHRNLYGQLWNDRKEKGLPMEKDDQVWRKGLLECLVLDIYCKDELYEKYTRRRLER